MNLFIDPNPEEDAILEGETKNDRRLFYVLSYSGHATILIYLFYPLIYGVYEYYTNNLVIKLFPLPGEYFMDVYQSPYYEIVYIWLIYCFFYDLYSSVGIDTLFYGIVCNICAHFKIVRNRFERMDLNKIDPRHGIFIADEKELIKIINYHEKMIEISERLRKFLQPIINASFLVSPAFLCVLFYSLILNLGRFKTFIFMTFAFTMVGQVFTYCSGGTKIANAVGIIIFLKSCKYL